MADRITVTLHELVSALDNYADEVLERRHGVSFNLFEFVAALVEQAPIDITRLALCLGVSKAAVSKRVPGLVAGGWVRAATDPGHGRRVVLTPTEQGRELVRVAGGELDAEFTSLLTDPRLAAARIDLAALNSHLNVLTDLVGEKSLR